MIKTILAGCFFLQSLVVSAQQYTSSDGSITFSVRAPAGDLLATDSLLTGFMDVTKGDIVFIAALEGFYFISPFMPAHINETSTRRLHDYYLETRQYPKAMFKAKIRNVKQASFRQDGIYPVLTDGTLLWHGSTQKITVPATITVKNGIVMLDACFILNPRTFKIRMPEMMGNYYFRGVTITVCSTLKRK